MEHLTSRGKSSFASLVSRTVLSQVPSIPKQKNAHLVPPSSFHLLRILKHGIIFGFVLRILVFTLTDAPDFMEERFEISTPVTGFKRMKEGLFLFRNGIDPYEGGLFHQAPLLLLLFHLLSKFPSVLNPVVFATADAISSLALIRIARLKLKLQRNEQWKPRGPPLWDEIGEHSANRKDGNLQIFPELVSTLYSLNPLIVAGCLGRSSVVFNNVAVMCALYYAMRGKRTLSMLSLALATYFSLYPVVLFGPCVLLLAVRNKLPVVATCAASFLCFMALLLYLSYELMGRSWNFIFATYGVILSAPDLTPNIGLWWYFNIEIFDEFRLFFLGVFNLLIVCFALPVTVRMKTNPLFAAYILSLILAVTKSYPSILDIGLYMSLFSLNPEVMKYMRHTVTLLFVTPVCVMLPPTFHYLWIYQGRANSNFLYAATLVVGAAQVVLLIDSSIAHLRREWERVNGEWRGVAARHS
ncbi:PIG-U-domain-containing protein [Gonapodya prolifera JEL478]|uniref:PIG-U-domain-containing protein n=1 Tax=Gonapodya prolifera (strain JEL478) TaxID=1344416 RepID=A0A139B0I0_GONPJ|nr:PIG-U-domain-containing protein [Gonapodya prolifera JEL478]|eukprot:KXS22313.1 PIG-U-domain-containing protein [Gonapodya prolifera JEL478]